VSGNPDEAVALLQPLAENPALLLVRIALVEALEDSGRTSEARAQLREIGDALPIALAEWNYFQALQPFNAAHVRRAQNAHDPESTTP
ncbi:MAG TPA: tetratricopeptide repeat protein, partial [Xanthomonadaceae bacterium]|nr:tetratricopeptide repeat protein [Xanthomonadaceae bacterium]